MTRPTDDQLTQVRGLFVGQRVRIYGGKEITVERVEAVDTLQANCFQFYAKGKPHDMGFVATLAQVSLCKPKSRARGAA